MMLWIIGTALLQFGFAVLTGRCIAVGNGQGQ